MGSFEPSLLAFARDLRSSGDDPRAYRRAVDRGRLVRVHRGAYLPADRWKDASRADQHRWKVIAAVLAGRTTPVVSHISAAVMWGAPVIGPMPSQVHVLTTIAAGTRTEHGFRKHATPFPDAELESRGQLQMTGLVRTLAEVAADSPFTTAVGVLDWAMRTQGITRDVIAAAVDRLGIRRGRRAAARAIGFADGRAGSPGESLSRVRIHEAGFPPPELQTEFRDRGGLIGYVDFWWPELRLIGEFDGVAKYVREELTGGRSIEQVVLDEKHREDRLRARGTRVARWGWATAWSQYGLYAHLLDAGLPSSRRTFR